MSEIETSNARRERCNVKVLTDHYARRIKIRVVEKCEMIYKKWSVRILIDHCRIRIRMNEIEITETRNKKNIGRENIDRSPCKSNQNR